MSLNTTIIILAEIIAICMSVVFIYLVVRYTPAKVVETQVDPPPNAHYLLHDNTAEELEPETEAAIHAQKVAEVFYHALVYNDGYCSVRALYKIIGQHWNSHYETYPEYKKHWHISRSFIEEAVMAWDYTVSGRVVQLSAIEADEPRPVSYVLLPCEVNGGQSRRLYAVESLVNGFIDEPKAPTVDEPEPLDSLPIDEQIQRTRDELADLQAAQIAHKQLLADLLANQVSAQFLGVPDGDEAVPIPAKKNGYHAPSLAA